MDLSEAAASHGTTYSPCEAPKDCELYLETALLCTVAGSRGSTPNEHQFLEHPHIENTETLESCYDGKQAMDFTITADETILMSNDTPNAAPKLAGQYDIETTSVGTIRASANELASLTREVD